MTSFGSLCLRCARRGRTCCQKTEIYVTCKDVERIAAAIGSPDFFEYRVPENPAYADQADDPVWQARVLGPLGRRRVLKHDPRGDCLFLAADGCRLPLAVRPLVCRLHPHRYNHEGLYPGLSDDCPLDLLQPEEHLEELILGFDRESTLRWHRMLYAEIWQEEPACTSDSPTTCAASTWRPDTERRRPPSSTATTRSPASRRP